MEGCWTGEGKPTSPVEAKPTSPVEAWMGQGDERLFPSHLFFSWDCLETPPRVHQQKSLLLLQIPTPFPLLFLRCSREEGNYGVPTTLWVSAIPSRDGRASCWGGKHGSGGLEHLPLAQCPGQAASASDGPHRASLRFISTFNKQPNICLIISVRTKVLDVLSGT